jgi:hypothetical protein
VFSLPHAELWLALIVGVSILLMLVRARNIPEVYWIAAGVCLLLFSVWSRSATRWEQRKKEQMYTCF